MKNRKVIVAAVFCAALGGAGVASGAPVPGGSLDPATIPKYVDSLPVPQTMPKSGAGGDVDFYRIGVRQFQQQILPQGLPPTTVWGYGSMDDPGTFGYPARTIEAQVNRPVRVQWVNDLVDRQRHFLPHLLPVDQTLHWANPPQDCIDGERSPDCRGSSQEPYEGPVPIVTHVHGAHVGPESDGHPEAWYLPFAHNIPPGYATKGSHYTQIAGAPHLPGQALYQYPNDQRPTTLWYHDHALGMTRANVYTGLGGFYLLRDRWHEPAGLPRGPQEIGILIQDKSFNSDGSLFYPPNRAFFEGLEPDQLQIPFIPEEAAGGRSDVPPIWNPEFFGNVMVVNGKTWPVLNVEARRYRLRLLNGDDSRVLILKVVKDDPAARPGTPALSFWQIGAEGGYLPKPVALKELLVAPAERADVVVDFSGFPQGTELYLINEGPDSPFKGGRAPVSFPFADPSTTGQVMKIVVGAKPAHDPTTPPARLALPPFKRLERASVTRIVTLNEAESATVRVVTEEDGSIVFAPNDPQAEPFAPVQALLGSGTLDSSGDIVAMPMMWDDPITETPALGVPEIWEIYNFTEDAHPIHLHQVQFEVVNRQEMLVDPEGTGMLIGQPMRPEPWETGTKDTVLAYPGAVTRLKVKYDIPGLFVWHCHIISHEDNEMMRPVCVGPLKNCENGRPDHHKHHPHFHWYMPHKKHESCKLGDKDRRCPPHRGR